MHELDERGFVVRVLAEWWESAANALPWASMALDDRFGELRRLTEALVSTAVEAAGRRRDPEEKVTRSGVVTAAIEHGRFRGRQGGTWELVLFELTFLSDAFRVAMRAALISPTLAQRLERELAAGLRVARPACNFGLREALHEERSPERAFGTDSGSSTI